MILTTEKTIVIRMSQEEAGILMALLGLVRGYPDSLGRKTTDSLLALLFDNGVCKVSAFDEDTPGITSIDTRNR
jgi:hypothetical protein